MLSTVRARPLALLSRRFQPILLRTYAGSAQLPSETSGTPNVSKTNELPTDTPQGDKTLQEFADDAERMRVAQAPNRKGVWSRSQQPRAKAMSGPRFEQTIMEYQPQPEAAINLIHKQPVRWVHERVVECDGGGGALGHPRVFINVDKPQICQCGYCGLPFANEHHRKHLESLSDTSYPLIANNAQATELPAEKVIR